MGTNKGGVDAAARAAVLALCAQAACSHLPQTYDKPASQAFADTAETTLGRAVRGASREANAAGQNAFLLLGNGRNAFVARATLAHLAERSIDVQYYLYHGDLVGKLLTHHLLEAADRGVRVRILVDDMDLEGRDFGVGAVDAHPNVEVRIFNPFDRKTSRTLQLVSRAGSVTRRMHNKSFTVDNQATILGGRNIGDEYFDADPELAFADLDVLALGPVASAVSTAFDRYWNSELAYPAAALFDDPPSSEDVEKARGELHAWVKDQRDNPYVKALQRSGLARKLGQHEIDWAWGDATVIYDLPEKLQHGKKDRQYHLRPQLEPFIAQLREELIIFSPYFVPGDAGTKFLGHLESRGISVRVLTNSLSSTDVAVVHSGYADYRKPLLRAGVELHELNAKRSADASKPAVPRGSTASLHAKSFVFDRRRIFIGSFNLDARSAVHNTEIGVVIDAPEIAGAMAAWFDRNVKLRAFHVRLQRDGDDKERLAWHGLVNGKYTTLYKEPFTSWWKRFKVGVLRVLPLESQL